MWASLAYAVLFGAVAAFASLAPHRAIGPKVGTCRDERVQLLQPILA